TIGGTMIGEMMRLTTSVRRPSRPRRMPYAASVPRTVDTSMVTTATWRLSSVARSHGGWPKYDAYHLRDHPGGGNARKSPALSESGTTTNVGRIRKKDTAPTERAS